MNQSLLSDLSAGGLAWLGLSLLVVVLAARALLSLWGFSSRHPAVLLCAYWIAAGGILHLTVLLAGSTFLLNPWALRLFPAAGLLLLVLLGRSRLTVAGLGRELVQDIQVLLQKNRPAWPGRSVEKIWVRTLFLLLSLILLDLFIVALLTPVVNHDSHRYRLARIGLWLQHNQIGHFETVNALMNFQGRTAEFLMLWLISFFPRGYPLIHLVQWSAGVATLAATYELARRLRLPRTWRLASLLLLLGMPNVLVQFTTSQTDLTAAAYTTTGLVFVHEALRKMQLRFFLLAGIAFGLAIGTKQTVLVWGSGFAVIAWLWLRPASVSWSRLFRPAALAGIVALPFCLPLFLLNHQTYGSYFVPKQFLAKYPSLRSTEEVDFSFYPSVFLWHLSWPDIQAPLLSPATRWLHQQALVGMQRTTRKGDGEGLPHCATQLKMWLESDRFHEDIVPPALTILGAVLLALICFPFLLFRHRKFFLGQPEAAMIAGSGFFLLCSLKFGWEIYSWRFWVIPAPVLVLTAALLPRLANIGTQPSPRVWRGWMFLLLLLQIPVIFLGLWNHGNNGLKTLLQPSTMANDHYRQEILRFSATLDRRPRKILCDTSSIWLSGFFRGAVSHQVTFASRPISSPDQELTNGHYDTLLIGHPPLVDSRFWLIRSVPSDKGNVWLLRRLDPGESPPANLVWKKGHFQDGWIAPEAELEVTHWPAETLTLRFKNFRDDPLALEVAGAGPSQQLLLPPHQWSSHKIRVQPDVTLLFKTGRVLVPLAPDTRALGVMVDLPVWLADTF